MPVCAGYNCHKRIQKGTSLFKFPKNNDLCRKWLECLGRTDLFDFSYDDLKNGGFRVCQKHFHVSDVYKKGAKTFLKKSALPTVQQYCSPNDILKESPFSYFTEEGDKPIIEPRKKKLLSQSQLPLLLDVKQVTTKSVEVENTSLEDISVIHYCSIPMCSNNSQQQPHLKFHTLPSYKIASTVPARVNPLVAVWKKFLNTILSLWGMQEKMLKNQTCLRICSIHFKVEDFIIPPTKGIPGTKVVLKATSFPSVDPLFESYLTAQKKLQEDQTETSTTTSKKKLSKGGSTSTTSIVLNSSQNPTLVTKPNMDSIRKANSASTINISQSSTTQQPLALGTLRCPNGSLKVPISRVPNKQLSKPSYYLLPVLCTKQESTQKMLLIPTGGPVAAGTTPVPSQTAEVKLVQEQNKVAASSNASTSLFTSKTPVGQTLKTIKIVKPMNINITATPTVASVSATNTSTPDTIADAKPAIAGTKSQSTASTSGYNLNNRNLVPISAKPKQTPKAGTFLNLNDLASSNKISNINLKFHGPTVSEKTKSTKQSLSSNQTPSNTQLVVSSVENTTVTLASVQSDPFPTVHSVGTDFDKFPVLKKIKIEENLVDPALQPFLLSTSRKETAKQDTFVANFLTNSAKRASTTEIAELPEKRVKIEVEDEALEEIFRDAASSPMESGANIEDPGKDRENLILVTDNGPYAMRGGQPRCGRKPPVDHPWDGTLLEHVTYGISAGQPKLAYEISNEDPLDEHDSAEPQCCICQYCSAEISETTSLLSISHHEAGHTLSTTYYCRHCSDTFRSARQLHTHVGTHSVDGRIKCQHCDRCFVNMSELLQHSDIHIDELPLQCPLCFRSFFNKTIIRNHIKQHAPRRSPVTAVVSVDIG